MSPALMLIFGGAVATAAPASTDAPPPPAPAQAATGASDAACRSQDARDIVVCAQRQSYRLDPSVMEANQVALSNSRSATSATPPAQAACSTSPSGCEKSLESLDWANVAIVVGTTAVRAAKGEDWTRAFKPGGPDEYQLYQQAKQRRETEVERRAAAAVKRKAEEEERQAHTVNR